MNFHDYFFLIKLRLFISIQNRGAAKQKKISENYLKIFENFGFQLPLRIALIQIFTLSHKKLNISLNFYAEPTACFPSLLPHYPRFPRSNGLKYPKNNIHIQINFNTFKIISQNYFLFSFFFSLLIINGLFGD